MEQKDHQQTSDKIAAQLRFGRAIHFSYPHLKQVTARHRPSKIVLVDKIKASEDWRAQAFLLERRWPNENDFERVTFWARRQIWRSLRLIDLGLRARCIAKFRARS